MDICDGYISRKLGQRTIVGALIDQIVDRASTMTSCIDVIIVFPEYKIPIYLWMVTDIFGHWIYFYSCCYVGAIDHKLTDSNNVLMQWYYRCKPLMFLSIVCTETFWISAYWYKTMPYHLNYIAVKSMILTLPLAFYRTIICIYQIYHGINKTICHEKKLYDK